ncbi:PRC-barrel domain-containing protein, partial [Geodermatophilus sp. CPCC 205761]|uniref:PRC-barrel domain-containing protein n=1 Tax=Geodermatophilus sp. CPCC 205761 TaxID=2936597 RepID=UPI003EEB47CF
MGLPDRDVAAQWVGRTVVDRDGTEIGACAAVFADEATGLPEWIAVEVGGTPAIVPLVDAEERGTRVRVTVRRSEVESAPETTDTGRLSEAQEATLYSHYGIEYSREASESLLPAGEPAPSAVGGSSGTAAGHGAVPAEPATGAEPGERASGGRGRRPALALGALAALGAVLLAAASRRRQSRRRALRRPATPAERAAARALAAVA